MLIFVPQLNNKAMENKDFIIEEKVLVNIWQYEDAPYRMECYDGYAIGTLLDEEYQCPNTIRMEYPKLADVLSDMGGVADDILQYRGLYDKTADDIHYGDIMMYLGEIVS
jgi:hypothetical protein